MSLANYTTRLKKQQSLLDNVAHAGRADMKSIKILKYQYLRAIAYLKALIQRHGKTHEIYRIYIRVHLEVSPTIYLPSVVPVYYSDIKLSEVRSIIARDHPNSAIVRVIEIKPGKVDNEVLKSQF